MEKRVIFILIVVLVFFAGINFVSGQSVPTTTAPASHLECKNKRCERVQGVGKNECATEGDSEWCQRVHRICLGGGCIWINETGTDECKGQADTASCIGKHRECKGVGGKECILVDGKGFDRCVSNLGPSHCPNHMACYGKECIAVPGTGEDECKGIGDDQTCIGKHRECGGVEGKECIIVDKPGFDSCTHEGYRWTSDPLDYTCPNHWACENHLPRGGKAECIYQSGTGVSECKGRGDDAICKSSTSTTTTVKKYTSSTIKYTSSTVTGPAGAFTGSTSSTTIETLLLWTGGAAVMMGIFYLINKHITGKIIK